ncbi:putative glycosyltransferase [Dissulfuribacter thermophilus]|uniref:Putative glycosyltransferase n=1 Tax=Dissulfuribacter thermophilus TaxID=1156395 RepID=A0A1B9F4Z5_9BACT|nr:glycosyltransferase family 4 protein [Dissulfuribacter thermophilus]OCC15029.1 putative glycosyltransferase [Dissulfuribacter thermophilus]
MKNYRKAMKLIYLSTSKLHRNRANLIQTLYTVSAISKKNCYIDLYLPPVKKGIDIDSRLKDIGIEKTFNIFPTQLLHSRWKILNYLPLCLKMKRIQKDYDNILIRSYYLSKALITFRIPHIFEVHNVEQLENEGILSLIINAYNNGIIRYLISISKSASHSLIKKGANPDRISIIPCGVDYKHFSSIPLPQKARFARPRIMYIGRISNDRGLEIFKGLAQSGIGKVTLVGDLETPEADVGTTGNLELHPFVPHRDVIRWYEKCDIVLLPYQPHLTTAKSFSPLKLFEAMAAGRPIIASDLEPLREIIEDGVTGLLVEPTNLEAWKNALLRLKQDPDLAMSLGQNARQRARLYSWENRAEKILEFISGKNG